MKLIKYGKNIKDWIVKRYTSSAYLFLNFENRKTFITFTKYFNCNNTRSLCNNIDTSVEGL